MLLLLPLVQLLESRLDDEFLGNPIGSLPRLRQPLS